MQISCTISYQIGCLIDQRSFSYSLFSVRKGMTQFSVTPRFWLISFVYLTKGKIWPNPQRNLRRDRCEICVPLFSPSFAFPAKAYYRALPKSHYIRQPFSCLQTPTLLLPIDVKEETPATSEVVKIVFDIQFCQLENDKLFLWCMVDLIKLGITRQLS